jgi:hypothetical protein
LLKEEQIDERCARFFLWPELARFVWTGFPA